MKGTSSKMNPSILNTSDHRCLHCFLRIFNIHPSLFTICPRSDDGTTTKRGILSSGKNREREEGKTGVREDRGGDRGGGKKCK
jgi:hypothetical protein